jgi:hypothetical protein
MSPSMMTAIPPLPPEIMQQQQPASAVPMYAQMGAQATLPNPVAVLSGQIEKLKSWAAETAPLLTQVNPGLATLLVPIAEAGKALESEIEALIQRTSGPSPQVAGTVAPNVPGNIPGARPVA